MASIDFAALKLPLTPESPCGPDLDFEGDDDFMNYLANIEGRMPTSFFEDGQPFTFRPDVFKIDVEIEAALALLQRTRDLRLVTLIARVLVLSRDLHGFAQAMETIAAILGEWWDDVHPRAENNAYLMRAATIGTLNETTVVFSLQYTQLCDRSNEGPASYRSYLYAAREAEPREGEESPSEAAILQTMRKAEAQTLAARASLEALRDAVARIGAVWTERADFFSAPNLKNLGDVVARMLKFIDLAFPPETPAGESALTPGGAQASGDRGGSVTCPADAVAALTAATDYFMTREPSSPVLPLVAQARTLLGRSFIEVLQTLLPDNVGHAAYKIGDKRYFPLPVQQLAALLPEPQAYGEPAAEEPAVEAEYVPPPYSPPDPVEEVASDDPANQDGASEETPSAESEGMQSAEPAQTANEAQEQTPLPEPASLAAAPAARAPKVFVAQSRAQALGLLDQVASFLRADEPSSPVPWLIERARALADRDFLSVLAAVLPNNALSGDDG